MNAPFRDTLTRAEQLAICEVLGLGEFSAERKELGWFNEKPMLDALLKWATSKGIHRPGIRSVCREEGLNDAVTVERLVAWTAWVQGGHAQRFAEAENHKKVLRRAEASLAHAKSILEKQRDDLKKRRIDEIASKASDTAFRGSLPVQKSGPEPLQSTNNIDSNVDWWREQE